MPPTPLRRVPSFSKSFHSLAQSICCSQSDLFSAHIACGCWGHVVLVFAFGVDLVVSHIGVDSSTFHVAFEHTWF